LGCISIVMLPIPVLLFKFVVFWDCADNRFGKQIRGRSKMGGTRE